MSAKSKSWRTDRTKFFHCFGSGNPCLGNGREKANRHDQIFFATCTPDTVVPSAGCWLQHKLGATNAFAMDINAACSGFVYALSTADAFIRSGQVKTSLVVGSETLSSVINWEDRGTCILFGDGGGAVVVEQAPADSESRIYSSHLRSDGGLWDLFQIPAGGSQHGNYARGFREKTA